MLATDAGTLDPGDTWVHLLNSRGACKGFSQVFLPSKNPVARAGVSLVDGLFDLLSKPLFLLGFLWVGPEGSAHYGPVMAAVESLLLLLLFLSGPHLTMLRLYS